jgi:hypothetical protein
MIISNEKILNFCERHPEFNVEKCLLFYITSFENVFTNISPSSVSDMFADLVRKEVNQIKTLMEENVRVFVTEDAMKSHVTDIKDMFFENVKSQMTATNFLHNTVNEMIKDTFTGENSVSKVLSESCRQSVKETTSEVLTEIASNQRVFDSKVTQVSENVDKISTDFSDYLEKMKISKGIVTERKFHLLLESSLPGFTIERTASSQQKGRADITVSHIGKPTILIDTKDYTGSVPKAEVIKFENDMLLSANHGILVSPFSNISGKLPFQLSIISGKVAIYISNCGLDVSDVIKAINVIYEVSSLLHSSSDGQILDSAQLQSINNLIISNEARISSLKNHLSLALTDCNGLLFDGIKTILSLKSTSNFTCSQCNVTFQSARSLGGHKKGCKGERYKQKS